MTWRGVLWNGCPLLLITALVVNLYKELDRECQKLRKHPTPI